MAPAYISTPQTNEVSTFSHGYDPLDKFSPEKSFAAPAQNGDLIAQMRDARKKGMNLKTPRVGGRDPLRLLPNGNHAKAEFTPLLKSVTKTNMSRRMSGRRKSGLSDTPILPTLDESNIRSEQSNSILSNHSHTPMPHNLSSSAASTPMAQLPARDGGGVLNDGNVMTLREQENIIDKIEKENFGLKMKIHFLEEALSKRGSEFNQAALKENTDLKVNRITMQRELHKFKKVIAQAERDAELYRQQLEEYRERVRRKHADESVRAEMDELKELLKSRDSELETLRMKYESSQGTTDSELERLRSDMEDVQAELREKERLIEEREDEIDALKSNATRENNAAADLEEELDSAKQEIQDLKNDLDRAVQEVQEAKDDREEADIEKRRAEQDLDELRDEMANKSFSTKGLSRQLEEKASRLEEENLDLQERHTSMQTALEEKSQTERRLQEQLRELQKGNNSDLRHSQQELEAVQQQRDTFERKYNGASKQLETAVKDLQLRSDEKDLLQSRHDALTNESAQLQNDLAKVQKDVADLEALLDQERERAAQNDHALRSQHQLEVGHLNEEIDGLHQDINQREKSHTAESESWAAEKRSLEASSQRSEEKAAGLQRTVDKLQDAQGTLSGQEMRLQEALESENQRHLQEEKILTRQIEELNEDLIVKRRAVETSRSEVNNAKEELRISIREQAALKEKVAELEDEIEVLQADIEQEHEMAQQMQQKSFHSGDVQVNRLRKEKQDLQESLAHAKVELEAAKRAAQSLESERDSLEAKLDKVQSSNDDTFDMQQEKRELRRANQRLEKDLEKLQGEKETLTHENRNLNEELDAEIDRAGMEEARLNAEIDKLRTQHPSLESKDRELATAKSKVSRLESRVKDLEDLLDGQLKKTRSPSADVSSLRKDLEDARQEQTLAGKKEAELKASNRELKMKINDMERELHEARLNHFKSRSPSATPSPNNSREAVNLRREVVELQADVQALKDENRDLKRNSRGASSEDTARHDAEAMLQARVKEVERLNASLQDYEDLLADMRKQLSRVRAERDEARTTHKSKSEHGLEVDRLTTELKRLRMERENARDAPVSLSNRDKETYGLKTQLKRLREERSAANRKAEAVEQELDIVQSRYESILERLSSGVSGSASDPAKEIKGLMKEVMWLKAKCRREQRLRMDLAWSKTYLEKGEAMRVQCNQVDLRILRDMGVEVDRKKYEKPLRPVQKFRAGVFAVIAAIRMSNLEEQWRDAKQIGEDLRAARQKQGQKQSGVRRRMI